MKSREIPTTEIPHPAIIEEEERRKRKDYEKESRVEIPEWPEDSQPTDEKPGTGGTVIEIQFDKKEK